MNPPATLCRITPRCGPWPLHDAAACRAAEQAALARHEPFALMARAGLSVARLALARWPHARRVQVWAGPGNNGGDGLVAALHLHRAGLAVSVALLADPARLPADARRAWDDAQRAGVDIRPGLPAPDAAADLHIDALLGLGANRAAAGALAEALRRLQNPSAPVLAVDVPSGLHPDTGQPLGPECVHATATLSLLAIKPGGFTAQGRDLAGEAWFDSLGVDAGPPSGWLAGPASLQARPSASHKGSHGDVIAVGGAAGMSGAVWLAARAALAAGAGRVFCCPLHGEAPATEAGQPELMVRPLPWLDAPHGLDGASVVAGCGGGQDIAGTLPALLSRAGRLVLDADALNALAADEGLWSALLRRSRRGRPTLITPHPLEAARLLQRTTAEVQGDRLAAADELARRLGATVLLKGSGSVVATPGELPFVIPTGNAALATAGTGDVLAGWAAGLWAQAPVADAHVVAAQAAWSHGSAADHWPAAALGAPLRASELLERLARRAF